MPKSKRKKRSNSKSGYIGVVKNHRGNKYQAKISINGKNKYLGSSYDIAKQAANAYDKEAIKLRRPLSKLNFPTNAPVGYTPIQKARASNNTVGYRGVYKVGKKFQSSIYIAGKKTNLGTYETAKQAAVAYDWVLLKANQSTTLLNFPDMVHNLDVEPKRKKQKVRSNNTTGYKGVSTYGKHGKFRATILITGKSTILCGFATAIQAALAYDQAAIKAGRKSHTLNFPMDQKEKKKQNEKKKQKKQKKQKKTEKKELTLQEYKEMLQA